MTTKNCPKCGAPQEGGDECLRCGIIFSRYHSTPSLLSTPGEDPSPTPQRQTVFGMLRSFYRVFRWVSLGIALIVLGLILRNPPLPRIDTEPEAKERAEAKFTAMQQASESGQPYKLQLNEAELNAWLGQRLVLAPNSASEEIEGKPTEPSSPPAANPTVEQVRSTVRDVKIDLLDDRLRGYVIFDFHGKDLSLMIEGRLSVQGGYLRMDPTAGRLGALPLPPVQPGKRGYPTLRLS